MRPRRLYWEVFLVALAVILLEVSYTRVFSYKLIYYFTYVIIGIALLGLGSAGIFVTVFPRLRGAGRSRLIAGSCLIAAASVLLGYVAIARTPVEAMDLIGHVIPFDGRIIVREGVKLAFVCTCLFVPFFAGGVALAVIFSTEAERIARLYSVDLLGAGLGCAVCVPLMQLVSPPGCILLSGVFFALAGLRLSATDVRLLFLPTMGVAAVLLGGVLAPSRLPEVVPDGTKNMRQAAPGSVFFSRWSPVFRIDVVRGPKALKVAGLADLMVIMHDGMIGSILQRFDGDIHSLAAFDRDSRSTPFSLLAPAPRVAIIGAAGGHEILASLYFKAAHVTAVELNPVTVSLLTTHFADHTGRLAENPSVTLINGEGRWFLEHQPAVYDLIWFVAPDSYAAMNAATSGSFVLSESYLYTVEMIVQSLRHLSPDGIVCVQFGEIDFVKKPNRTLRYLATAREAFARLGITDFDRHVLVTRGHGLFEESTVLLKRSAFTPADLTRLSENTARTGADIEFPGGDSRLAAVVTLSGPAAARWYDDYPFDVRPVTDDAPFFWHFVPFTSALQRRAKYGSSVEEGAGERLLLILLVVVTMFAAAVLLAPMRIVRQTWRTMPHKGKAGLFFAAIGVGFMFFEVTLIQRLTLFLGYPTYSLTVTLFALLVSTGVGSLLSERWKAETMRVAAALVLALGLLVLFYTRGLPIVVAHGIGWPFAARVAFTVAALAPLGLCLGTFMPMGLRTVAVLGPQKEEFVAWCWAVNGFFSVVSSVLATILSMTIGFEAVLMTALGLYLVAIAVLVRLAAAVATAPATVAAAAPVAARAAAGD